MSHLIFTLDFHEIVRGNIQRDSTCTINYDPLRLAAAKEGYIHGSPNFEFTAHLQFKPEGATEVKLTSGTGILENAVVMNNGRGSMLTGDFKIPADAEEIIVWISLKDDKGAYSYDSDLGRNFHFRLAEQDIQITKASVENSKTAGTAKFTLSVAASQAIDKMIARYRVTNGPDPLLEIPVELTATKAKKNQQIWDTGGVEVPYGSVVIYDLIYFVGDNKFKVENNGNYFIAHAG